MKRYNISKNEILKKINHNLGIPNVFSENIVNSILEIIIDGLNEKKEVKISGFGTFRILNKNSRIGRNPKTGKEHLIKTRKSVSFYPSKKIKIKINE